MRPKAQLQRSDRDIARYARSQHGVLTLVQLAEVGLSARAVSHRVATGRLHRVYRGVYAVGEPSREGRWMGALLASRGDAVLSHRSAAALWGIHDDGATVHVTRAGRAFRAPRGIEAHSGSALERGDRAVREGIPCTSLPRTLIDLATQVDRRALTRAIDRAEELRVFDLHSLRATLAHERGRRGVRAVSDVLATYAGPAMTRNEVETRFLSVVSRAGLKAPEVNVWIPLPEGGGYRPDFLWRDIGWSSRSTAARITPECPRSSTTAVATAVSRSPATRPIASPRPRWSPSRGGWSASCGPSSPWPPDLPCLDLKLHFQPKYG